MILVDECRWPFRDRLWCHLVSDTSYEDLHLFTRQLGKPRVAFQGDHYDLHEAERDRALELGALPVESRILVASLKNAGLRRGPTYVRGGLSAVQHLPAPTLSTRRLTLRQWRDSDIEAAVDLSADPVVMEHLGGVRDRGNVLAALDTDAVGLALRGIGKWAVELTDTGEFMGRVGTSVTFDLPSGPNLEMAWRLARRYWGNGFATEAARAAMDYAFDHLEVDEVVAVTAVRNTASQAVMHRLGMTFAGNFDHRRFAPDDPLRPHVLYRADRSSRFTPPIPRHTERTAP